MNAAPTQPTDEELVVLIQKGDKEKFGILMERYEQKLFRYGRKFLSNVDNIEDMVQEVFIKTYESIQSFDTTKKFSPWIYRIAHNTFVNALKKNIRNPLYLFDFDTLIPHPAYDDPAAAEREQKEMRVLIDRGLEKIKPEQREILVLNFLEDLSYKEIAEVLRIPIGTVGVRIRRAKEALKKVYDEVPHNI